MNDSNIFVGIHFHKRYSVISAQNSQGGRLLEARVEGNTPDGFKRLFRDSREKAVGVSP